MKIKLDLALCLMILSGILGWLVGSDHFARTVFKRSADTTLYLDIPASRAENRSATNKADDIMIYVNYVIQHKAGEL